MRSWGQRCRWVFVHLCWNDGEPDPRVLQGGFTLVLFGALALRTAGDQALPVVSWPVFGVLMSSLAAFVVMLAPPSRLPLLTRVMAVVNIAALGMLAAGPDPGTASPLVVLPAMWLALELGLRGAAISIAAVLAFITVPGLVTEALDTATVERLLILPAIAGVACAAITGGVASARNAQTRAEARETELAEALAVIERSRRTSQAIFEAVDVGLALIDLDGQPLLVNHRLGEFMDFAYPAGDVEGGWVFDESGSVRLTPPDVPTSRARRGEEFDDVRVWIGRQEEHRRAMSVSARRVEDAEGQMVAAAVSYADITEIMRALRVKDDFVALVSHELRTPLTSIVGYVAVMLERTDLDPVLRKHLEAVARNGQRLQRLVGDLLEETQHSGRRSPLHEEGTDLAAIVRERVQVARPGALRAGVRIDLEVPETIAFTGDPQRLALVLDNLVSNAVKHTERGGSARVLAAVEDGYATIRVCDTGMGIRAEDQPHLFNRFFRTQDATLSAIQGVGLGLSISKSIVESHGGLIEVDSELGRGSEFRVVLPLHVGQLAS